MGSSPRRITALAVAAIAALSLGACSGSSSGNPGPATSGGAVQITLSHGYTDVEAKAITAQVATWNASHPKIQVKLVFNGGNDGALQKTLAGMAAGSSPDIAYEYGSSMAALAGRSQVVDLTDKVKDPSFKWDDFYSFEREATMSGGKVYGVPALVDNLALVYNKKLFDAAGLAYPTNTWTWDDFRTAAKKLTDAGRKQYGWAYVADGSEDTTWRWLAMFWQAGGDLVSADGKKAAFDSPAGLKATQLLHDMATTSTCSTPARSGCCGPARGTCPASTPGSAMESRSCPPRQALTRASPGRTTGCCSTTARRARRQHGPFSPG
jgi:multiple sugar transport system substrate-binding protein